MNLSSSIHNGPTRHSAQAQPIQHYLQPPTGCEDAWWQARLPPYQKACHRTKVRRLWYRSPWRTLALYVGLLAPLTNLQIVQVPALRPRQYATISKRQKTVQRAYGGSRCGDCVKSRCVFYHLRCDHHPEQMPIRILRAFLVEEAKIVKKVIKSQTATRK